MPPPRSPVSWAAFEQGVGRLVIGYAVFRTSVKVVAAGMDVLETTTPTSPMRRAQLQATRPGPRENWWWCF